MSYDTWKSTAPDDERCCGVANGCECDDCRAAADAGEPLCIPNAFGLCVVHEEPLLCPHACECGECEHGCDELTDHELREPKAVAR